MKKTKYEKIYFNELIYVYVFNYISKLLAKIRTEIKIKTVKQFHIFARTPDGFTIVWRFISERYFCGDLHNKRVSK